MEPLRMWRSLAEPIAELPAPNGVAFRTFEPGDAPALHALLDEAYLTWDRGYVPLPHEQWVEFMVGDSEFDASLWWLAERDGALAGCALHWSSAFLKDVAVREIERGRGVGAALVTAGLLEFRRRGFAGVGLKVDRANPTGAQRLYERLGFVAAGRSREQG